MTKGRIFLLFGAGILAGGAVVALVMNGFYAETPREEKQPEKSSAETNEREEIKTKNIPLDSTGNYLDKKLPIAIKGDTSSDYYKNIEESSTVYDSLITQNNSTEVSINRDRMLESLKVKVNYIGSVHISPEDSLLNKMNSIKTGTRPVSIEVEIWQSPIQYKGYKMGKNKLVVYGIDPSQDILLFDLNDYVLLQSGQQYYRLEKTSEFKNLRKFNDQTVIARLKQ